jgi:hypothetical protein
MINQLLKLGLFVTLGVWLKNRGKALCLLVVVLGITWIAHNEYLSYITQSGDDRFLGLSYGIKWGVFILSIITYYVFIERKINEDPKADRNTISHPEASKKQIDGFDFLRQKRTLESEADKVLKKSKK